MSCEVPSPTVTDGERGLCQWRVVLDEVFVAIGVRDGIGRLHAGQEKTLEGQVIAAAKGNHGGRPKVIDDDMLTFAIALKDKGVPVPDIAKKLTIKTGKNAGKSPSVASLYRAFAEA